MKNLFIITARSGSKGLKNKNIKKINGISLIGFKAISALKSNYCNRLIISTDSEVLASDARSYGVEVPFLRPKELAKDSTSSIDTILHAMDWIEKNDKIRYENIILLQPTSPFSTYKHINEAINLFNEKQANSVISIVETKPNSKFIAPLEKELKMSKHFDQLKEIGYLRRQDQEKEYTMNGAIYISKWDYFKKNKSFFSKNTFGYVMKKKYSIDIDKEEDLLYAKFLIEKNIVDINLWQFDKKN